MHVIQFSQQMLAILRYGIRWVFLIMDTICVPCEKQPEVLYINGKWAFNVTERP
jgi:hypothetical protein